MGIARVVALALVVSAGCAAETASWEKGDEESIELSFGGKADDPLMDAAELARIEAALDRVITEGDRRIAALESQIADLERRNRAKATEIDNLVRQIEARRRELEDQHRRNLVLCVFFPDPSICLLAVVIDNDSRMRDYQRQLDAARAEQSRVQSDMGTYQARRDALRAQIAEVRAGKAMLVAMIRGERSLPPPPAALAGHPEVAGAYVRIGALRRVRDATQQEIDLLVRLRSAAAELAASLDAALATVRGLATAVDELVEESREVFMDLLEGLLSDDPDAMARDFLDDAIARRTREMLSALDWPVRELVEHLLATAAGEEPDLDGLREELLAAFTGERSTIPVGPGFEIRDLSTAFSEISAPAGTRGSRVEVDVQIQHTWRGDLVVRLELGTTDASGAWSARWSSVLHDRTGGSADDLRGVFSRELPGGDGGGTWRLVVEDRAGADVGRLERWSLSFRSATSSCDGAPNDTEATATRVMTPAGCGLRSASIRGEIGGSDVDVHVTSDGDLCAGDMNIRRVVGLPASSTARVCIHARCATGTPAVTCHSGSGESSASGLPGCCGAASSGGPALHVACASSGTTLTSFFVTLSDPAAMACMPYEARLETR